MSKINDRWSALSMKDRAALIDIYVKSGITDLGEIRKNYNGIPYRDLNTSNYDYFNASPEMTPTKEGQHWDSRNPHTGRLLKREDHPTFDLLLEGEKQAGYKVIRGYNGELYSIPNEPNNYVEDYNSFDYGGDTESPVDMGELEASFINPKQSRVNRRREVRRAFKSIKNLIRSNEIDAQDILNAYNGLNENQRRRALESAMKFSPLAQPDGVLNVVKQHVLMKPRQAFKTLKYIMTGKGKPSLFAVGYDKGYNGLWNDSEGFSNGIIDAIIYGNTIDPRIGTQTNKEDFGPELDYIRKNYKNKDIQYIQTNPGVTINQQNITPTSYVGSNGSFNTSIPGVSINNQGFILEKGTRNDSTFVRGLDVYDFKPDDYSKKWDTENMYPVIQQIDTDTNPVAIKTPWVPEEEINTILSNPEGYTPYRKFGGKLNSFGDGGRILDGTEEEQTLSGESWYKRLGKAIVEGSKSARDVKIGAVGAQQIRDLYLEGKNKEAQKLAQQYAKANTTGIALTSGIATSSLLGDLAVTGVTTTADTLIDGDVNNFGKNLLYNAAANIAGHGAGKAIDKVAKTIKSTKLAKALNNTKLDDSNLAHSVEVGSKIIPAEAKDIAIQDAIAFEDALVDLNRTEQIKRFNAFAKKYGYEEIGENVSDEVLNKATKEMLERHNTFFRGVRPSEEVTNLATKLGISEEEALKIAATTPRAGDTHIFVSPADNAGIYGGKEYVAQVRRPYKLGNDRTQWFNEANFEITPGIYSKGNEDIIDPWFSSTSITEEVPNELLIKKGEFIDWVEGPLKGKGSNNKIFRRYDKVLNMYEPEELVKFASGGKLNKFETGGHTEPLYYDDTYIEPAVVKAFNSIEDYNRYQGRKGAEAVRRGMNKAASTISEGLRYTPVVGDVMDGLEAYEEAKTGNLTKAGVLAGLTFLPNALEKPVKAVGKGLKNLRLYNRYIKDAKRFEEPIQFALKGMEENYDVLKSNFPEMNTIEDARRTMDTNVSTRFDPIEFVLDKVDGHYDRGTDKIWLNAYSPTRLKQAWKSPKKAIKFMKQAAAHEGAHSAIYNLNIPMSEKYEKYYRVIPGSTIDNNTKHLYNKAGREGTTWQNLPEEFIAEMNAAKYTLGEKPGSSINSWSTNHANRSENYLSKRFKFEPGETGELIDIYEGFGFDNGGFLHIDPFNLTVPQDEDSIITPYKDVVTSEMNQELIQPTQDKAYKFVETMYPIIEQTLVKKGYSTKNINNILRQMAFESDYGLSPRGNGYNLSGIKSWNKNEGTKHSDGFMYRNFKDYSDYADFYIDLLNNRFDAINAKDSNDYIYRLHHGKKGEKYSSNETGYMNVFNNMRALDKAIKKYLNK